MPVQEGSGQHLAARSQESLLSGLSGPLALSSHSMVVLRPPTGRRRRVKRGLKETEVKAKERKSSKEHKGRR